MEMCGTCKHSGGIVGYRKYRRFHKCISVLNCERYQRKVREDDICLQYESHSGRRLPESECKRVSSWRPNGPGGI